MKTIKLTEQNLPKLQAELDSLQKRCSARTIDAKDIVRALEDYTERLNISKKAMDGIEGEWDLHAQAFPNAYKYDPESTHFTAQFKRGSWYITGITRESCGRPCNRERVKLTAAACEAYLSHVCDPYHAAKAVRGDLQ